MPIWKTPAPSKATPQGPAFGSLTGRDVPIISPPIPAKDVKNLPNKDGK
jgi:hypothetical protein